jgi:hypothetical protein
MQYYSSEQLQLGQTGWILGDLPNLLAGSLDVQIDLCPNCRKLEFFAGQQEEPDAEPLPQKNCPKCGARHDFDYPKCPACGYDYYG